MRNKQLFLLAAAQQELCFTSYPNYDGPLFNYIFNEMDFYTPDNPESVISLISFVYKYAIDNKATEDEIRTCYGILNLVSTVKYHAMQYGLVSWTKRDYSPNDPSTISLYEWLVMNGYTVPEYTEPGT